MTYGIGLANKLGRENRKRLENPTDTPSEPSTPSYSYYKLNENTSETQYRTIFYLKDIQICIHPILKRNVDSKYLC